MIDRQWGRFLWKTTVLSRYQETKHTTSIKDSTKTSPAATHAKFSLVSSPDCHWLRWSTGQIGISSSQHLGSHLHLHCCLCAEVSTYQYVYVTRQTQDFHLQFLKFSSIREKQVTFGVPVIGSPFFWDDSVVWQPSIQLTSKRYGCAKLGESSTLALTRRSGLDPLSKTLSFWQNSLAKLLCESRWTSGCRSPNSLLAWQLRSLSFGGSSLGGSGGGGGTISNEYVPQRTSSLPLLNMVSPRFELPPSRYD